MKKDFNIFFTKQGDRFELWKALVTRLPALINAIVLLIGIGLIAYGQDTAFIPDIGIGLLTSSVVTLVFLFNDHIRGKIASRKNRALFLKNLYSSYLIV